MSSTILNALNAKEEKLQVKKDKAFDRMRDLEKKRDIEISAFVKNYFVGIETDLEDVVYEDSTSYMEISCKGQPYEKQVWSDKLDDYETVTKYGKDRIAKSILMVIAGLRKKLIDLLIWECRLILLLISILNSS